MLWVILTSTYRWFIYLYFLVTPPYTWHHLHKGSHLPDWGSSIKPAMHYLWGVTMVLACIHLQSLYLESLCSPYVVLHADLTSVLGTRSSPLWDFQLQFMKQNERYTSRCPARAPQGSRTRATWTYEDHCLKKIRKSEREWVYSDSTFYGCSQKCPLKYFSWVMLQSQRPPGMHSSWQSEKGRDPNYHHVPSFPEPKPQ